MKKFVVFIAVNYLVSLIFLIAGLLNKYNTKSALSRYFVLMISLNTVILLIKLMFDESNNNGKKGNIDIEIPPLDLNFEDLHEMENPEGNEYSHDEHDDEFQEFDIGNVKE